MITRKFMISLAIRICFIYIIVASYPVICVSIVIHLRYKSELSVVVYRQFSTSDPRHSQSPVAFGWSLEKRGRLRPSYGIVSAISSYVRNIIQFHMQIPTPICIDYLKKLIDQPGPLIAKIFLFRHSHNWIFLFYDSIA